jgi:aminoglycoside phosphotransferase (APT) family kinase protein
MCPRTPIEASHTLSQPNIVSMSHTVGMEVISDETMSAIVATVEPSSTVVGTSALPGGLSSWMTTIEIERPDGSRHRLVVRRGRRPDAQRHTLPFSAEFELLEYLESHGLPVARPRAFDDSAHILPQAYVVLDFVEGATRFTTHDPVGMAVQMADVLAAIHDVDATSASLPALRKVPHSPSLTTADRASPAAGFLTGNASRGVSGTA